MARILVTGASGLLGLNLALMGAEDHEIFGVANSVIPKSDAFVCKQWDLTQVDAVGALFDWAMPDWVVHGAAIANLRVAQENPALAQLLNGDVPGLLANEAAARGVRFLHVSTDAVFDGVQGEYVETDVPNAQNVYAATKLAGERAVMAANQDAMIARVNFYGWSRFGTRSLVEFFYNHLKAGEPMKGFVDAMFNPTYVGDLVEMLLGLLAANEAGIYHAVASEAISKYDFGVAVAKQFGFDADLIEPISINDGGLKVKRSLNLTLNTDKITKVLGKKPATIAAGLTRLANDLESGYVDALRASVADFE